MSGVDVLALSGKVKSQLVHQLTADIPYSSAERITNDNQLLKYLKEDGELNYGKAFGEIASIDGFVIRAGGDTIARWWVAEDNKGKKFGIIGYISVPKFSSHGKENNAGVGKNLLANMVAAFEDCGVDIIKLKADYKVGPYFWAQAGAIPAADDWYVLRNELKVKLDKLDKEKIPDISHIERQLSSKDPKAIWQIADSSIGKTLLFNEHSKKPPKNSEPNTSWYGQIKLSDSDSVHRMQEYLGIDIKSYQIRRGENNGVMQRMI